MISFEPFRKLLESKKISTYFLRNKCGDYNLDSKTIQRLMNDESVSTHTINSLCSILNCSFTDIMEFLPDEGEEKQ
jgi:Predicted transcriptional regulator